MVSGVKLTQGQLAAIIGTVPPSKRYPTIHHDFLHDAIDTKMRHEIRRMSAICAIQVATVQAERLLVMIAWSGP